jgi:hypothetical protein
MSVPDVKHYFFEKIRPIGQHLYLLYTYFNKKQILHINSHEQKVIPLIKEK